MDDNIIKEQIEAEIGIDQKIINDIYSCIIKGSVEEVHAKRNQFPSITYNSKYNDIWDSINAKCTATFSDGYKVTMHKRGIYQFITIVKLSSSCIYILMREKNFKKIITDDCKSDTHYMKCLTLINDDLCKYPTMYGQLSIFDIIDDEQPQNIKLLDKKEAIKNAIISKINTNINRFAIITFEPDLDIGVKAIYVNVVAKGTSIKYRKDWSPIIKALEIPQNEEAINNNETDSGIAMGNLVTFDSPAEVKIKKGTTKKTY